jgi:transketolase
MQHRRLPEQWDSDIPFFPEDAKGMGGRDASGKVQNAIAQRVPWLIGGAADLAPSTKTRLTFEGAGDFGAANYAGRNFHFGIREHAMGSILNGMSLSKIRPFGSGFLIFSDYMRAPIRLSASDGTSGHLHLHARFHRRGRRWTHAPAGGTTDFFARHPRPDRCDRAMRTKLPKPGA